MRKLAARSSRHHRTPPRRALLVHARRRNRLKKPARRLGRQQHGLRPMPIQPRSTNPRALFHICRSQRRSRRTAHNPGGITARNVRNHGPPPPRSSRSSTRIRLHRRHPQGSNHLPTRQNPLVRTPKRNMARTRRRRTQPRPRPRSTNNQPATHHHPIRALRK